MGGDGGTATTGNGGDGVPVPQGGAHPGVLVAVGLGGALGAPARYWVSNVVRASSGSFPWATFWTNVSGSVALGLLLVFVRHRLPASRYVRPFLATGFLGAYTTYSTFAVDSDLLVRDGRALTALVYAAASLVGGLLAVWAGILLARRLLGLGDRVRAR